MIDRSMTHRAGSVDEALRAALRQARPPGGVGVVRESVAECARWSAAA
jgi:hypothetical protein